MAQVIKNMSANAGDIGDEGSIPGLGRFPGGGHGNPLQYLCQENPHGQRSLVGCSPWGRKELNITEWLSTAQTELAVLVWVLPLNCCVTWGKSFHISEPLSSTAKWRFWTWWSLKHYLPTNALVVRGERGLYGSRDMCSFKKNRNNGSTMPGFS